MALLNKWLGITVDGTRGHYEAQRRYSRRHLRIGVLAALLSVVAGGAAGNALTHPKADTLCACCAASDVLTDIQFETILKYVVVASSLLAAALAALQTFFQDADRSGRHRLAGAGYAAARRLIQEALALPVTTHLEAQQSSKAIREVLDQLSRDAPEMPSKIRRWLKKEKCKAV